MTILVDLGTSDAYSRAKRAATNKRHQIYTGHKLSLSEAQRDTNCVLKRGVCDSWRKSRDYWRECPIREEKEICTGMNYENYLPFDTCCCDGIRA